MNPAWQLRQAREVEVEPVEMSGITDLMLADVVQGDPARGW